MKPAAPSGRVVTVTVALLLAALVVQCVLSMRLMSASYDEHSHIPAGYTYWKTGDFRLNPQHPPLVKLLAGLPLLALQPKVDWNDESWAGPHPSQWRFGTRMLYLWGNDADRILFWARLPIVGLSALLAVYVFLWSKERFGAPAGLFALLLYAFCPNVIAHSRLVTMDLALSAFTTIALYYLWRFRRTGARRDLVATAVGLGLALASKFSALVLVPIVVVWASWPRPAAAPKPKKKARATAKGAAPAATPDALAGLLVLGVAALVVWVAYLFPSDPAFYWNGVSLVNRDHNPDHRYYLMGEFKPGRWWYYFLVAFSVKTPVPVLLSLAAALVLAWRARREQGTDDLFLVLPALAFFAFTSALADDLGIRYVLPVFPLLFVFVSRLAAILPRTRPGLAALAALALWQVVGALRIYPDYLAYFNELSGGPSAGYRWLDDSNVDWGQDLKRLGLYLKEQNVGHVELCFDLLGHPPYYGIDADRVTIEDLAKTPKPGTYAIATHCLLRAHMQDQPGQPTSDWRMRYTPIGRVGYSFYLFRF